MTAGQLSFLDTGVSPAPVSLPARARRTDPPTSKAAAASLSPMVLNKQRREALAAIRAYPHGATAYDVACSLSTAQNVAVRRCKDLEEMGLVYRTERTRRGPSGRSLIIWEPVP